MFFRENGRPENVVSPKRHIRLDDAIRQGDGLLVLHPEALGSRQHTEGLIVGSALVELLIEHDDVDEDIF